MLAALALGAGLMTMPAASAEQSADEEFPNLPTRLNRIAGQQTPSLVSSYATNVAFVGPSKQWVRMLDLKVLGDVAIFALPFQAAQCEAVFGVGSVRCVVDNPNFATKLPVRAKAYPLQFIGDDVSSPPAQIDELRRFSAEFTSFPTQRVRTLALGSVPVEADLDLRLATDEQGLPLGIQIDADTFRASPPIPISDSIASGKLVLRLSNVTLDGVDFDVGAQCEASGELAAEGRGFVASRDNNPEGDPNFVPPDRYNPRSGGVLQGTLTVGAFAGCADAGDDLSPALTALVGRTDVPVRISQGRTTGLCFSDNVRQPVTESRCVSGGPGDFPEGEQLPALPPVFLPPPPVG